MTRQNMAEETTTTRQEEGGFIRGHYLEIVSSDKSKRKHRVLGVAMTIDHVKNRLAQREIDLTPSYLASIAQKYEEDVAVILGKRPSQEGIRYGLEVVILIV